MGFRKGINLPLYDDGKQKLQNYYNNQYLNRFTIVDTSIHCKLHNDCELSLKWFILNHTPNRGSGARKSFAKHRIMGILLV